MSPRKAPIQIAFGVMIFQRQSHTVDETIIDFQRLMNQIYEDEHNHIYVLHTDYKSEDALHVFIDDKYCQPKANCMSIESRSVTWAGITVVEMNMALMQAADDFLYPNGSSSSWDYFVLLGHESIAMSSLHYTENYLLSYPSGTNFINCWRGSGYDFFGQHEDIMYRLSAIVVDSFEEGKLIEWGFDGSKRHIPSNLEIYKTIQYVTLSRAFIR